MSEAVIIDELSCKCCDEVHSSFEGMLDTEGHFVCFACAKLHKQTKQTEWKIELLEQQDLLDAIMGDLSDLDVLNKDAVLNRINDIYAVLFELQRYCKS